MKNLLRALLLLLLLLALALGTPSGSLIAGAEAENAFEPLPMDAQAASAPDASGYFADGSGYEDESLSVRIEQTRAYDTAILIARVRVADPSQLRTAMAGRYGSDSQAPGARIAKRVNAVFAINGDYFNFNNKGFVVRQGKRYRNNPDPAVDVLLIDDAGDFHIVREPTAEALEAVPYFVVNAFSFGPALVVDGQPVESAPRDSIAYHKKTQRMVVAQTGPLSYLCVATEGPENADSVGLTIPEITEFMAGLGCQVAYNLDGGSSSTMVLNNEKINALSTHKVRPICDILYFCTLVPAR